MLRAALPAIYAPLLIIQSAVSRYRNIGFHYLPRIISSSASQPDETHAETFAKLYLILLYPHYEALCLQNIIIRKMKQIQLLKN